LNELLRVDWACEVLPCELLSVVAHEVAATRVPAATSAAMTMRFMICL
jgi:hypothetical protein